jgi:integrase
MKKTKGTGATRSRPPRGRVGCSSARAAADAPSFAAWLQVAAFTGMRPGELDALRWSSVDFAAESIAVGEQFSAKTGSFSLPKNGETRAAILTPPAKDALLGSRTTRVLFRERARHALDGAGEGVPLEGRARRGRLRGQLVSRDPAFRWRVHDEHAALAGRGRRYGSRAHGRRVSGPDALRAS